MEQPVEDRVGPLLDFGKNITGIWAESALWGKLAKRINTAAGPYEMVAAEAMGVTADSDHPHFFPINTCQPNQPEGNSKISVALPRLGGWQSGGRHRL